MTIVEPAQIGVSEATHAKLIRLKEDGHFREMADAYRFAIGLALAQGIDPPELSSPRTVFGVATIDPDQSLKNAVQTIMGSRLRDTPVYRMAEETGPTGEFRNCIRWRSAVRSMS